MPKSPLARDLIQTAEFLVGASPKQKPRQADLRRAVSTAYYAVFHTLCFNCANCIVGKGKDYPKAAWRRSYRALNHGFAKDACDHTKPKKAGVLDRFPDEIKDFAYLFYDMQIKRHLADYDPYHKLTKSEVETDISAAKSAIVYFEEAPLSDRKAFTTLVLFQNR